MRIQKMVKYVMNFNFSENHDYCNNPFMCFLPRISSSYDKDIHTEQYCNFVGAQRGEGGKSVDKNVILQQLGIIYESKKGIFWA